MPSDLRARLACRLVPRACQGPRAQDGGRWHAWHTPIEGVTPCRHRRGAGPPANRAHGSSRKPPASEAGACHFDGPRQTGDPGRGRAEM